MVNSPVFEFLKIEVYKDFGAFLEANVSADILIIVKDIFPLVTAISASSECGFSVSLATNEIALLDGFDFDLLHDDLPACECLINAL
tara:strand:+ start:367 stop:627 length:261 start_codon:yes stop_codon:yes gene_type:complete